MWDRHSLQIALLGQPVLGDPLQIAFGATHVDKRQLAIGRHEPMELTQNRETGRLADSQIPESPNLPISQSANS